MITKEQAYKTLEKLIERFDDHIDTYKKPLTVFFSFVYAKTGTLNNTATLKTLLKKVIYTKTCSKKSSFRIAKSFPFLNPTAMKKT